MCTADLFEGYSGAARRWPASLHLARRQQLSCGGHRVPPHPSAPLTAAQHNRLSCCGFRPQRTFMARCGLMPQRSDPTGIGETRKGKKFKVPNSLFFQVPTSNLTSSVKNSNLNCFSVCVPAVCLALISLIPHTHTHAPHVTHHNTHTPNPHQRNWIARSKAKLSIMMRLLSRPPKTMFFPFIQNHFCVS
jgi:hypothetical protein